MKKRSQIEINQDLEKLKEEYKELAGSEKAFEIDWPKENRVRLKELLEKYERLLEEYNRAK